MSNKFIKLGVIVQCPQHFGHIVHFNNSASERLQNYIPFLQQLLYGEVGPEPFSEVTKNVLLLFSHNILIFELNIFTVAHCCVCLIKQKRY